MEHEGLKGFFAVRLRTKDFDHQPDNGTQFEFATAIVELGFKQFSEVSGQPFGFLHIIQVPDHGQLYGEQRSGSIKSQARLGRLRRSL